MKKNIYVIQFQRNERFFESEKLHASFNSIIVLFFVMKWNYRENIQRAKEKERESVTKQWLFRLPGISSSLDASRALETACNCEIPNLRERQTTTRLSVRSMPRYKTKVCTSPTLLAIHSEYYYHFNNDITWCTQDR